MTYHDYHIEMTFPPFASILTPEEAATFAEKSALPTLEALGKLSASGKILAGGSFLGATGFSFIIRAASPEDLEDMVTRLPLWPRSQTRVVPLGTFERRAAAIRERLPKAREAARPPLHSEP
jgi:hypothetical protein